MNLYRSFKRPFHQRGKYYRINYNITAPTVRLLGEDGKQIGIFSKDEALRRARVEGVDLVEIAPLAKPPVCRIIDFKKFRYLESKKERESKKKTKNVELKQITLSPFIGEHDLLIKQNKGREFLKEGNRLKLVVHFRGRQLGKKQFGFEIINKLIKNLSDIAAIDRPPHHEGQLVVAQLTPTKRGNKETNEIKDQQVINQKVQINQKRETASTQTKQ